MREQHKNTTVLGPDCRISGELTLDNDAVIMGQFKGTLRVSGLLELTDSAEVSGSIIVGTLRLAGRVEADVVAENGVELLAGADLAGQLFTSRLNVVEGAVFRGEVCVGPTAMQAASEAFRIDDAEAQSTEPSMIQPLSSRPRDDGAEIEDDAIKTMPGSANAVLKRRRTKLLSPRPSLVPSGDNQPQ